MAEQFHAGGPLGVRLPRGAAFQRLGKTTAEAPFSGRQRFYREWWLCRFAGHVLATGRKRTLDVSSLKSWISSIALRRL